MIHTNENRVENSKIKIFKLFFPLLVTSKQKEKYRAVLAFLCGR